MEDHLRKDSTHNDDDSCLAGLGLQMLSLCVLTDVETFCRKSSLSNLSLNYNG
jgi:hypothetical protein